VLFILRRIAYGMVNHPVPSSARAATRGCSTAAACDAFCLRDPRLPAAPTRIDWGVFLAVSQLSAPASFRPSVGNRALVGAAIGLVAFLLIGIAVAYRFVAAERERDLAAWQNRLGLIADGRAAAVADWVARQFDELNGLAENASVQLYMTELAVNEGDRTQMTDEPAQASYLRNVLVVHRAARRLSRPGAGADRQRQCAASRHRGIALLDAKQRPLVATPEMPPVEAGWRAGSPGCGPAERALLDIFPGADGAPAMAFIVPIFSIEGGSAQQIGSVLG